MKKWIFVVWPMFWSSVSFAGNIAIIDFSTGFGFHLNSISNQIRSQECFSSTDQQSTRAPQIGEDQNVSQYYIYRMASGCNGGGSRESGQLGFRHIRDYRLNTGGIEQILLGDSHLSNVTHNALLVTSQKVVLLNMLTYESGSTDFVRPRNLDETFLDQSVIDALDYVYLNRNVLDIRVVVFPISWGTLNTKNKFCDNDVSGTRRDVLNKINRLIDNNISVVAAAGNDANPFYEESTGFPACMQNVISVGGYTQSGTRKTLYGAYSLNQDFIETVTYPSFDGGSKTGTSFAAPKVAGYISELLAINPSLTARQVEAILIDTADSTGRVYYPDSSNTYHNNRLTTNFQRAKAAAKSDSIYHQYLDFFDGSTIAGSYGSQFGTNSHPNGLKILFNTSDIGSSGAPLPSDEETDLHNQGPLANTDSTNTYYRLRLKAYDIDTADEVKIYLNGQFYDSLETTSNNSVGAFTEYLFNSNDLLTTKSNIITLDQKINGESWGVQNLSLAVVGSNTGDEETVSLAIGAIDNKQYGQNYGRDGNVNKLDVQFTPEAGKDHTLSWRPFDVEDGEMDLFLNNIKVKTVPETGNNQLGAVDQLSVPAANLATGINILSFRVDGGDGTWGITRLVATPQADVEIGEPGSGVLLDAPDEQSYSAQTRSYSYNFDFTPRGFYYDETIGFTFGAFLRHGTRNGFVVRLNGQAIRSIGFYTGAATTRTFGVTVDKSQVNMGSNVLTIETRSTSSVANTETKILNVKVVTNSTPFLNVAVESVTTPTELKPNTPFEATAIVANVGAKASSSNTLSFYVSTKSDLSTSNLVASKTIPGIAGETSRTETVVVDSSGARNGGYIWACISRVSSDVNVDDDCSPAIRLDIKSTAIAPIIMLLLGD